MRWVWKKIQTINAIDEPLWEELDRRREEYIRIHGEAELDDNEEDNWELTSKAITPKKFRLIT